MGIRVELEVLAVLLLLTPIVSDGLRMTKCQLMDQLMSKAPADALDHDNLVAKSVCHAEVTSHFDTSVINHFRSPDLPGIRKTRSATRPTTKAKTPTKAPTKAPAKTPAKTPTKAPAKTTTNLALKTTVNPKFQTLPPKPQNSSNELNQDREVNETEPSMPLQSNYLNTEDKLPPPPPSNLTHMEPNNQRDVDEMTLYGMFQLADRVACASAKQLSMNICNLTCDKLLDDDISDDFKCFQTIINSTWSSILTTTCPFGDFTLYLAECKTT